MACTICGAAMRHLTKDLFICDACSLVSSDIRPDPSIYDRSYEIKYSRYERTETGRAIQELRSTLVRRHVDGGGLLDFGCGVGSFIKHLSNGNHFSPVGFDINPYTAFCDVATLLDKYRIVTFWDSIEHIENPVRLIKGLGAEWVFACTPSIDGWERPRRELTEWRHYMPSEHCHYFNEKSLRCLMTKAGYMVVETNYDESVYRHGGGPKNILSCAARKAGV